MIKLKYASPVTHTPAADETPTPTLFGLYPQGEPVATQSTQERLEAMKGALKERLQPPVAITCNPHRIGKNSCVAIHLEDSRGKRADILVTQEGRASLPLDNEFESPRWYVNVPDAADMVYMTLWVNSVFND